MAFNIEYESFIINSEVNKFEVEGDAGDFKSEGYFVGAGYQIKEFLPMITYSHYEDNGSFGEIDADSISYSLRWDFSDSAALTVQYNDLTDNSDGDAEIIALGVDYVF